MRATIDTATRPDGIANVSMGTWGGRPVLCADLTNDVREVFARIDKRGEKRDYAPSCVWCGRKVGARDVYIFQLAGGDIVHPDWISEAEKDPTASWIGWMRVGTTCAKNLKGWTISVAEHRRRTQG